MVQPTANTELTIAFIRIIEAILCLLCLITHIKTLKDEEPMPHIVLFCGTFGGFFILSLAKLVVPISGQLSPPGVDLVFSLIGFILFYAAACAAMFFVQRDPHLIAKNGQAAAVNENSHVFFKKGVKHAILSITTGTLYLMHAVISADRLGSILRGIEEDVEREIDESDIDIHPDDTISLHLFFLNWLISIWNTACCKAIRKLWKKCQMACIQYYRKKRPPSYMPSRRLHRRARMLRENEFTRLNGITVSNIAPQEFIRNPRRTLAYNNVLAFIENENIASEPISINNDETPQQGPSSQTQGEPRAGKKKTVAWDLKEDYPSDSQSVNREAGDGGSFLSDEKSDDYISDDEINTRGRVSFIRNKEFGSEDDITSNKSKNIPKNANIIHDSPEDPSDTFVRRDVSFIRNEEFGADDEDTRKTTKIVWKTKKSYKTGVTDNLDDYKSRHKSVSFIRNEAFDGSDEDLPSKMRILSGMKESLEVDDSTKDSFFKRSLSKRKKGRYKSFTRNKEFGGSEGETKLMKFFRWFPRKAESVFQNIDEDNIREMGLFSSETTVGGSIDSRANSEVEESTFGFEDKRTDRSLLQRKTSSVELQVPIDQNQETPQSSFSASNAYIGQDFESIIDKEEPITTTTLESKHQETPQSSFTASNAYRYIGQDFESIIDKEEPITTTTLESKNQETPQSSFTASNAYRYMGQDFESIIAKEEPITTTLENKNQENEDTSTSKMVLPEYHQSITNEKIMDTALPNTESVSYKIQIPESIAIANYIDPAIQISENIAKSIQTSSLPTPNLIPFILTSTINKELKNTLNNETSITERKSSSPELDSTSSMNKISESTSETQTEYRYTFPELDSTSYMKEVASLIPSNKISESTSKSDTKKAENPTFPALDSTSYMKEVTGLIPSRKTSADISEIIIEEIEYNSELESSSYMMKDVGLILSDGIPESTSKNETKYQATFPVLDSSSYMKEVTSLIPSNRISRSTSDNQTRKIENTGSRKKSATTLDNLNEEVEYRYTFPELDSTSYLQTIAGLIPSNRNTENLSSSGEEEENKKATDNIEN